jgi:hypothetical protein
MREWLRRAVPLILLQKTILVASETEMHPEYTTAPSCLIAHHFCRLHGMQMSL